MTANMRLPRRDICAGTFWSRHPAAVAALAAGLLWGGYDTNASAALTCSITAPSSDVTIQVGQSVDYTGTVSGGKSPYTFSWTFQGGTPASNSARTSSTSNSVSGVTYNAAGTYTTTLAVTDNTHPGAQTCSTNPTLNVTVQSGGDTTPPTVSLAASPAGPTYTSAQTVTLTATASDNSGTVSKVEFYEEGTLVATDTASPFTDAWSITNADNGTHSWTATAYDPSNNSATTTPLALTVNIAAPPTGASINSTSQSCGEAGQPACSSTAVTQQPAPTSNNSISPAPGTGLTGYQIVAVNDLGMHCGDLDTRILSILPPYNVLNARVIEKPTTSGGTTTPLTNADVEVYYSAGSSSIDPVLDPSYVNPPGYDAPVGSVFKTNYWDVARTAYDPFYPAGVLPLFYPSSLDIADVGLAVPNLELWYLNSDGTLLDPSLWGTNAELDQQTMPAITTFTFSSTAAPPYQPTDITSAPYSANQPQKIELYVSNWPLFSANFGTDIGGFGYEATNVDWFVAEGVPMSVYDDLGRANSYPLMRVQAKAAPNNSLGLAAGTVLATVDTVAPISAEANCQGCHAAPIDPNYLPDNLSVATNIANIIGGTNDTYLANSEQDPDYGTVPTAVSIEWASDKNILRLHDYNEGSKYTDASGTATPCDLASNPTTTNVNCLVNKTPVVCQSCHYTPALDLLQVGPDGVSGPLQADHQANNQSMSRVMHNFHGLRAADGMSVSTSSTDLLFPYMPQAGSTRDTQGIIEQTCYQCHPGKHTKCLRGAMANADVACQDCHGQMTQVGDDFSKNLPGGSFIYANDFYTNPSTPRVPWVNEPSCGSCHTGDYKDSLANTSGTIVNATDTYGNVDGIRLDQAYLTGANCTTQAPGNCPKWTPIVPTNKRFAEDVVDETALPGTAGGANPKLFRVSVGGQEASGSYGFSNGHGPLDANGNPQPGLFCEACHGPTHAEWPVTPSSGSFIANDNQTAIQLQGHARVVSNCSTCHGSTKDSYSGLGGPHGLHTIGDNTPFANSNVHRLNFTNNRYNDADYQAKCEACHGGTTRGSSCGTVLSRAQADRTLKGTSVAQGTAIGCTVCHKADRGMTCP